MKFRHLISVAGLLCAALLSHAAVTGQSPLTSLRMLRTVVTALAAAPLAVEPLALKGPGLGNLSYTEAELFKAVSWIRRDAEGVPDTYPGRKAFGLNAGIMHNGYFLTLFAPDSGAGPGGFLIYDVSNPRAMRLVKRLYEPEGRTSEFREAHAFGTSTIGGKNFIVVATTKGIEFWDFTDINDLKQVKKLALPTVNAGDYSNVSWQLWWQAPYVYVASANDGVYIVDARDPVNAVLANRGADKPNPVHNEDAAPLAIVHPLRPLARCRVPTLRARFDQTALHRPRESDFHCAGSPGCRLLRAHCADGWPRPH